jgi:hypothetical protein
VAGILSGGARHFSFQGGDWLKPRTPQEIVDQLVRLHNRGARFFTQRFQPLQEPEALWSALRAGHDVLYVLGRRPPKKFTLTYAEMLCHHWKRR